MHAAKTRSIYVCMPLSCITSLHPVCVSRQPPLKYLWFGLKPLSKRRGLSILSPADGHLSTRSTSRNYSSNDWCVYYMASWAGKCFHWTKCSSSNFLPFLIQWVSRMCWGSSMIAPSSVMGGNLVEDSVRSPINFFKREMWKTGWMQALVGS